MDPVLQRESRVLQRKVLVGLLARSCFLVPGWRADWAGFEQDYWQIARERQWSFTLIAGSTYWNRGRRMQQHSLQKMKKEANRSCLLQNCYLYSHRSRSITTSFRCCYFLRCHFRIALSNRAFSSRSNHSLRTFFVSRPTTTQLTRRQLLIFERPDLSSAHQRSIFIMRTTAALTVALGASAAAAASLKKRSVTSVSVKGNGTYILQLCLTRMLIDDSLLCW